MPTLPSPGGGRRFTIVRNRAAAARVHRLVRQLSAPQDTPPRPFRPTVCIINHSSHIATKMIRDLPTPSMDCSNDVIEIFSRRVECHRSSNSLEYRLLVQPHPDPEAPVE